MNQKKYTVTYRVNNGAEKTESIWVDTFYTKNIEHIIKIELNESKENNVGIDNIQIIRYL
ncbi:hypothetical protein [Mesobacillus sp. S13]|uniref:hypothetical protein n=1 Tax=Mesobacillus sp. S13 TaxID=2880221 RepID=UPI001CF43FCB|nr:hypothetical protein [Mesobacillus sp. S13]